MLVHVYFRYIYAMGHTWEVIGHLEVSSIVSSGCQPCARSTCTCWTISLALFSPLSCWRLNWVSSNTPSKLSTTELHTSSSLLKGKHEFNLKFESENWLFALWYGIQFYQGTCTLTWPSGLRALTIERNLVAFTQYPKKLWGLHKQVIIVLNKTLYLFLH